MNTPITGLVVDKHYAADMVELRDELLSVYREAYADKIQQAFFTEDRFWERVEAYARRDGFELVTARVGGSLAGYALGYTLPAGSAWWHGLLNEVDPGLVVEDGSRTFALNYIMVRPSMRRRGIAEALHAALMRGRPESRATLLVLPDNISAISGYRKWGWHQVGELKPFADAPIYHSLLLNLTQPG
ncbi:GNAT family N-acetyltransferase [Catellatospora aurea]|uniref:GNAT family N-acetyltransferase n=1 Tax=Catellatospora aurea TaxID=1337874 RepID=A0ABW2GWJ7_9ACTN